MSEFKGTPGAWEVRVEQIAPGSNATCFTVATDDFDVVSPLLGIRCEDDAALIAAAPDLLKVLQEVQEFARGWSQYEMPIGLDDRINAAIAKALNTDTTER
jgi:hypothetical protein